MTTTYLLEAYRERIHRVTQSLVFGRHEALSTELRPGIRVDQVRLFTQGNFDKRFEKLQDACELLADGFTDLDDEIVAYVKEVPLSSYDTGSIDAERFLDWLSGRHDLTEEQEDCVTCLRSRHAVEFVALKQRLSHLRFQELLSLNGRLLPELERNHRLVVHLNPIHVWSRFTTRALLDEDDAVPATVIFFPVGSDIRTAVVEPEAEELLRVLEQAGVLRVKDLKRLWPRTEQTTLQELVRELAEMGLVALG
jgi:hypothetical protein